MYTYARSPEGIGQALPSATVQVTGPDYLRWVQGALNNSNKVSRNVAVDGLDNQAYRDAVTAFQTATKGLTPNGRVDVSTQNALIRANEGNLAYALWVQTSLNEFRKKGLLQSPRVPETGSFGPATRRAIRAFQRQLVQGRVLKFSVAMRVDGVVGPKTESILSIFGGKPPFSERM